MARGSFVCSSNSSVTPEAIIHAGARELEIVSKSPRAKLALNDEGIADPIRTVLGTFARRRIQRPWRHVRLQRDFALERNFFPARGHQFERALISRILQLGGEFAAFHGKFPILGNGAHTGAPFCALRVSTLEACPCLSTFFARLLMEPPAAKLRRSEVIIHAGAHDLEIVAREIGIEG
jgi:hypothetical protein